MMDAVTLGPDFGLLMTCICVLHTYLKIGQRTNKMSDSSFASCDKTPVLHHVHLSLTADVTGITPAIPQLYPLGL